MQNFRKPHEISGTTKKILSMDNKSFQEYVKRWEDEFIKENGSEVIEELEEVIDSAGEPNFEQVLFDEKSKGNIRIQYGRKGNDYIYHIFFKKIATDNQMIIFEYIFQVVAKLLPRDPEKIVSPPQEVTDFAEPYFIECYTLLVKDIVKFNGSRRIMEEVFVNALLDKLNDLFPKRID